MLYTVPSLFLNGDNKRQRLSDSVVKQVGQADFPLNDRKEEKLSYLILNRIVTVGRDLP